MKMKRKMIKKKKKTKKGNAKILLEGIKEKAKEQKKLSILKKCIMKTIPKLNSIRMKEYIDTCGQKIMYASFAKLQKI